MANNNQLDFFDKDYRPKIEKRQLIPQPRLIKIEQADSGSVKEIADTDRLIYAYDSSVE
jgi:hypothetical protein